MKHLFILLAGTFGMGIVSGMFIFFATQDATEPLFDFEGTSLSRGFEIIADTYGGCQRLGCVSYRISDNGSYTILRSSRTGSDIRGEGTLSTTALASLKNQLKKTDFTSLEASEQNGACAADTDGVAYQYEIRVGDTTYRLNSCKQNLEGEALFSTLETYFTDFSEEL